MGWTIGVIARLGGGAKWGVAGLKIGVIATNIENATVNATEAGWKMATVKVAAANFRGMVDVTPRHVKVATVKVAAVNFRGMAEVTPRHAVMTQLTQMTLGT